jgi:hypothetical protein
LAVGSCTTLMRSFPRHHAAASLKLGLRGAHRRTAAGFPRGHAGCFPRRRADASLKHGKVQQLGDGHRDARRDAMPPLK